VSTFIAVFFILHVLCLLSSFCYSRIFSYKNPNYLSQYPNSVPFVPLQWSRSYYFCLYFITRALGTSMMYKTPDLSRATPLFRYTSFRRRCRSPRCSTHARP
jgi:hypothetical protein